nr:glycosyltransferase [Methylobacterium dankookense]
MPAFPTLAGNRRRLLAVCEMLARGGFAVDFAYFAHEDQVYRRYGQHPPTDDARTDQAFRRVFRIEPRDPIPLRSAGRPFGIDDWCPDEVGDFVAWYFAHHPETCAIVVNYVFLSRALEQVPAGVLKLIDTHDRFADRHLIYRPFGMEPSFFYTDAAGEAAGLDRADAVLAIQANEAAYFRTVTDRPVLLLPPRLPRQSVPRTVTRLRRIGFIGHGNDANRLSIRAFAEIWTSGWQPGMPELVVAGEVCTALGLEACPGLTLLGRVAELETFYDAVDAVVAPMLMGTGLKMKVAEALSYGLPVVGTATAFDGFDPYAAAHRLPGVEAVREAVLALRSDAAALAALGADCADLFRRFEARCAEAEARCLGLIAAASGRATAPGDVPEAPAPRNETICLGAVTVTEEWDLRSLPASHPDLGILVATERAGPDAPSRGYTPVRRRWFARVPRAGEIADPAGRQALAGSLAATRLALSPEWVRTPALPQALREALAPLLLATEPDWWSEAELLGRADGRLDLVACLPSSFLSALPRTACFVVASSEGLSVAAGATGAEPLMRQAALRRASSDPTLALVPAVLALDASPPDRQRADRLQADRILILADDLIGHLIVGPKPA